MMRVGFARRTPLTTDGRGIGYDWQLRPVSKGGARPSIEELPVFIGDDLDPQAEAANVLRVAGSHCQDCIEIGVTFNPAEGWEWWMSCCCLDPEVKSHDFATLCRVAGKHNANLGRPEDDDRGATA